MGSSGLTSGAFEDFLEMHTNVHTWYSLVDDDAACNSCTAVECLLRLTHVQLGSNFSEDAHGHMYKVMLMHTGR